MSIESRGEMAQILNDATSRFVYDPLNESIDSIRLLYFEEGCDGHDILKCNLVHMAFREKPVYDALSYTWGGFGMLTIVEKLKNILFLKQNKSVWDSFFILSQILNIRTSNTRLNGLILALIDVVIKSGHGGEE